MDDTARRREFAEELARNAGKLALESFANRNTLVIQAKGRQDWVSEADRDVETFVRNRIAEAFPGDGVFGEEHGATPGSSGFDWVIDPIDGTTNFINGIPAWTIVLALVDGSTTRAGVIHDPNAEETFVAERGRGARLNGQPIHVSVGIPLHGGTVAVGYSNRVEAAHVVPLIGALLDEGAMFYRNASGALSLAYVAAGRLLGYLEEHMNAWDCLAGQLLIAEAGGRVEAQNAAAMIREGGRVVVGTPDVFDKLQAIADRCWTI